LYRFQERKKATLWRAMRGNVRSNPLLEFLAEKPFRPHKKDKYNHQEGESILGCS
jgi:hypothetical protein